MSPTRVTAKNKGGRDIPAPLIDAVNIAQQHSILPFLLPPPSPPARPTRQLRKRSTSPAASSSTSPSPTPSPSSSSLSTPQSTTFPTSLPFPTPLIFLEQSDIVSRVPLKYESQSDGTWVISECWDLHGQTWCQQTTSTDAEENTASSRPTNQNLEGSPVITATSTVQQTPSSYLTPSPSSQPPITVSYDSGTSPTASVSSPSSLDMSTLPNGWVPSRNRTDVYRIPTIVICSVLLAAFIVFTIWTCALTRRRRRARLARRDPESKLVPPNGGRFPKPPKSAWKKLRLKRNKIVEKRSDLDSDNEDNLERDRDSIIVVKRSRWYRNRPRWRGIGRRRKNDASSTATPVNHSLSTEPPDDSPNDSNPLSPLSRPPPPVSHDSDVSRNVSRISTAISSSGTNAGESRLRRTETINLSTYPVRDDSPILPSESGQVQDHASSDAPSLSDRSGPHVTIHVNQHVDRSPVFVRNTRGGASQPGYRQRRESDSVVPNNEAAVSTGSAFPPAYRRRRNSLRHGRESGSPSFTDRTGLDEYYRDVAFEGDDEGGRADDEEYDDRRVEPHETTSSLLIGQGHVATDDKAALARLERMRSAPSSPPPREPSSSAGSLPSGGDDVTAPVVPDYMDVLDVDEDQHDHNNPSLSEPVHYVDDEDDGLPTPGPSSSGKTRQDVYAGGHTNRAPSPTLVPSLALPLPPPEVPSLSRLRSRSEDVDDGEDETFHRALGLQYSAMGPSLPQYPSSSSPPPPPHSPSQHPPHEIDLDLHQPSAPPLDDDEDEHRIDEYAVAPSAPPVWSDEEGSETRAEQGGYTQ